MSGNRSVRGGVGRFPGVLFLLLLAMASQAAAGPIRESARRVADRTTLTPMTCTVARTAGAIEANQRRWPAFWFASSMGQGVYLLPIVPLFAHRDREPPDAVLADVPPPALKCFTNGYKQAAKRRRVRAAWTGWAIGAAFAATYAVVNAIYE